MKSYKAEHISLYPIAQLQSLLAEDKLDCLTLAQSCLDCHDQYGDLLECYHTRDDALFISQAKLAEVRRKKDKSPSLNGIPVSIKSIFAVKGLKCFAGTCKQLPNKWQQEGGLVKRLHEQSCPITGLTHSSELAFGGLGLNEHWGTPRNAWDPLEHRVPGGSSSGAALSVITGSAVFALGSDTGGSIRVPAAAAGMVGLKTSKGRWPDDGILPLCKRMDTPGIICRSVADTIDVYGALENRPLTSRGFTDKLSFSDFNSFIADESCFECMDTDLVGVFDQVIQELSKAGMQSKQIDKPIFAQALDAVGDNPSLAAVECSVFIESELPEWQYLLSSPTQTILQRAKNLSAKQYLVRLEKQDAMLIKGAIDMQEIDILISPTLSITPPTLEEVSNEEAASIACSCMLRNTVVANICGYCALTLPIGLDKLGIPVGLQLMAAKSAEDKLLQFALLIEKKLGNSMQRLGKAPLLQ